MVTHNNSLLVEYQLYVRHWAKYTFLHISSIPQGPTHTWAWVDHMTLTLSNTRLAQGVTVCLLTTLWNCLERVGCLLTFSLDFSAQQREYGT